MAGGFLEQPAGDLDGLEAAFSAPFRSLLERG
jgi:hypothetical protein